MKRLSIISTCLLAAILIAPLAFPDEGQHKTTEKKAERRESVKERHEGKIGKRDVSHGPDERSIEGSSGSGMGGPVERNIGGCPEGPPCKKKTMGSSEAAK